MNKADLLNDSNPPGEGRRLVLFDFDGTLTKSDSFPAFLWYATPFHRLFFGAFQLLIQLPRLFFLPADKRAGRAKAAVLFAFLGGKDRGALQELGRRFYQRQLQKMLRSELLETLRHCRDTGDTVVLVSASVDIWLQPFCDAERISLICTELAYEQQMFKGAFSAPNCNRAEKARRIREAFDLKQYNQIIAYGNSSGDAAMFELAQEAWYCHRDGTLKNIKHIGT